MQYALPSLSQQRYQFFLRLIGHAFFALLIVWSILFYQERMLNFDSAYYCFNVLHAGDFFLPHGRTINYASQWLPLLGTKMGWSLKTFLIVYSASFLVLHYLIYNIIVYVFRNAEAGIFLALCMCLTTRYKFYSGISEIYFSLVLVAFLIAWLTKQKDLFPKLQAWQNLLIAMFLVWLGSTSHPIIVVPILAFMGFDLLYHNRWKDGWNWGLIAGILALFAYRFKAMQNNSYEANRVGNAWSQWQAIYTPTEFRSWHIIKYFLETQYAIAAVVFLILVGVLLWQRKWLSGLFLLLCTFLMLLLVFVTYSYLTTDSYFMIDGYLGLIGVVWSLPILFVVLRSQRHWLALILSVTLLSFSLHRIYSTHEFFTARLAYLNYILDHNGDTNHRKLAMQVQTFDWSKTWLRWSIPYETLLISSQEDPTQSQTIYVANWDADMEKIWSTRIKFLPEGQELNTLPKQYFQLDRNEYVRIIDVPAKVQK